MSYLAVVYEQVDGTRVWSVFEPQAIIYKISKAPITTAIEQQQFVWGICIRLLEAFRRDDDGQMHFLAKCLLQELGHRPIIVHGSHAGEVRVSTTSYATAEDAETHLLELWPEDVP